MDIKLTNTGVIPLDDFREGQNFLVWFDIHCSGAVLLYKAGDEFLCSGNLRSVPKTQEFLAWEPVEIQHSFSPYVTKELIDFWFKRGSGLSCKCGDIYIATINNMSNNEGLYEIVDLRQGRCKPELFAKTFLGRAR